MWERAQGLEGALGDFLWGRIFMIRARFDTPRVLISPDSPPRDTLNNPSARLNVLCVELQGHGLIQTIPR